jgi:hypothetical protein
VLGDINTNLGNIFFHLSRSFYPTLILVALASQKTANKERLLLSAPVNSIVYKVDLASFSSII